MKIVVASQNPVKVNAVVSAFQLCFDECPEVETVGVSSDVTDQPMNDSETLSGARNRVRNALLLPVSGDFYLGIEGGIEMLDGRMFAFAWVVVSDGKNEAQARTSAFELPPEIKELIFQGLELGEADDRVFNKQNSKQQNGAVGLLTNDRVTRELLYRQAVILALIPFLNSELYLSKG